MVWLLENIPQCWTTSKHSSLFNWLFTSQYLVNTCFHKNMFLNLYLYMAWSSSKYISVNNAKWNSYNIPTTPLCLSMCFHMSIGICGFSLSAIFSIHIFHQRASKTSKKKLCSLFDVSVCSIRRIHAENDIRLLAEAKGIMSRKLSGQQSSLFLSKWWGFQ